MCQLSFCNLHSDDLNRELFLIMSSMGASVHKHGWGAVGTLSADSYVKCGIPGNLTLNGGELIQSFAGPLLGHIRLASAQVPVTEDNAHPFTAEQIFQMHNGTLTPKKDSDHVTHITVLSAPDAKGVVTETKVKRSDSEVFFEHFMKKYKENGGDFVKGLTSAMADFSGKFALMYYIKPTNEIFIVRGKTADLHISYLTEGVGDKAKVLGYVINTAKEIVETSTILLSNLHQARGEAELSFTTPVLLKEETIFKALDFGLEEIGTIKENSAYSGTYYGRGGGRTFLGDDVWDDGTDADTVTKVSTVNHAPANTTKYGQTIFTFAVDYSMDIKDMQMLFHRIYGSSLLDAEEVTVKHFVDKVLQGLRSKGPKIIRKRLKAALAGRKLPVSYYYKYDFPWMLNNKETQMEIVKEVEKERDFSKKK